MSTVAVTYPVDAPPDHVWRAFTDLHGRVRWMSTVERVEVVTPGPFGTGTVWREARAMAEGDRVTEEFRVVECEPGVRCVIASPGVGADYRMIYTFAPAPRGRPGTVITVVQEGGPSGPAGRLLAVLFGGLAASTVEGALRQDLVDLAAAATRAAGAAA